MSILNVAALILILVVGALGAYTQFLSYKIFHDTYRWVYLKKILEAIKNAKNEDERSQLHYLRKVYGIYLMLFSVVIILVVSAFVAVAINRQ